MSRYIANLISQGEHQQLDFKHSISDSRKIARTLAAFANTDGGTLLIGVKDNGNVSGVNSEEEYYMLEGAAQMYCKPEVKLKVTRWDINGKVVLEVYVRADSKNLYKAQDKNGKWKVFFRQKDENFVATPLQVKVWNAIRYRKAVRFNLSHKDQLLIDYLKEHGKITVDEYCRMAFIPHKEAENVLVNLAVLGIVVLKQINEEETFLLIQS
ncbi:MAG TPA: ATP-binding protein [Tenuifilaceae bacterium]|nr:ATP-binding protein [Tenuifilaceae bacterium]HPE19435.1 ATP-binding protein [Tenuifilaceae bacterium]HPJ47093.1 ATP-binding protein [Tenuifilaceae bacterium]HPQ35589.1 ATP-binding protein [Tenuifilaceae bacterium]HRX69347.1 ATP-binding protein [Tenuifilaceae bacterium]